MPIHNKLVRDLIPKIIEETGKTFSTRVLSHEEIHKGIKKEKSGGATGVFGSKDDDSAIEELADLLEIIHALCKCHEVEMEKVEEVRVKKAAKRGGFDDKIFLLEVED